MVTPSPTRRAGSTARSRRTPLAPVPATIERSEPDAQTLWRKTRATANKTYGDDALARRLAFSALKDEYERRGNRWVRKEPEPAPAPRPARRAAPKAVPKTARPKAGAARSPLRRPSRAVAKKRGGTRPAR